MVGVVAAVDQLEQPVERLVEVGAVAGVIVSRSTRHELAQAVEAVAVDVDVVVDGHDAELGPRLGVEQHEQPVQVAEALGVSSRGSTSVRP